MKLYAFEGAIDDRFEFLEVFHFAALGEAALGFGSSEPCRASIGFVRLAHLMDFHQERLDHELLHTAGLPEDAFRMDVQMKMTRLDGSQRARFFRRFALGGLTVREARVRRSFGKSPLA